MNNNILKKRRLIYIITIIAILAVVAVYAILPKGIESLEVFVKDGEVISDELEMLVGEEVSLSYKTTPDAFSDRKMSYIIADDRIATVSEDGTIKALSEGETLLTVEIVGIRKNISIKVNSGVKDIKIPYEEITLTIGETSYLNVELEMITDKLDKPEINFKSKDVEIAEIDKDGKITTTGVGSTEIEVSAGGIFKAIKVTVEEKPEPVYKPPKRTKKPQGGNEGGWESTTKPEEGGWE